MLIISLMYLQFSFRIQFRPNEGFALKKVPSWTVSLSTI